MSFSNPELTNPAQHFFEWKGGEGKLQFWDKEKKENVNVPLPFEFIPIDQLATITGYSKTAKNGYYSNEVRSTVKDELTIKIKGQTVFVGLYKNEQGIPQIPKGAGFTASIYIVHKNRASEYITGNLKANGSALGAWIEFSKNKVIGNGKVIMTRGEMQESPVGEFYPPEFKYEHLTPEDFQAANEADKELQIYLSQYLARNAADNTEAPQEDKPEPTTTVTSDDIVIDDVDDPHAGTKKAARNWEEVGSKRHTDKEDDEAVEKYQKTTADSFADEPINLEDIPF